MRSFIQFYSKQHRTTSILDVMSRRYDLHKRDHTSPELPRLKKDIQKCICVHKRQKWKDFVETMDQKTGLTKLWRTIKGIDGRAKRTAENKTITFNGICCCCLPTPMTLANGGGGESDLLACGPPVSFSVHLASSTHSTNPGVTMWCVCGCS